MNCVESQRNSFFFTGQVKRKSSNSYLKGYETRLQESERFKQFDKATRVFHRYGVLLLDKFG